jgi:hypothetical protein
MAIPKWIAVAVPLGLFLFNWSWATRNDAGILAFAHSQTNLLPLRKSRLVNAYVLITLVVFFAVTMLYVCTAPNPA